jgi:hypothetical protein
VAEWQTPRAQNRKRLVAGRNLFRLAPDSEEARLVRLTVFVRRVGVDQPGSIVLGTFKDGLEERFVVGPYEFPVTVF